MDSFVVAKDEIWFLRVCHHISKALYNMFAFKHSYKRYRGIFLGMKRPENEADHSHLHNAEVKNE
jgi:hypothetical protein